MNTRTKSSDGASGSPSGKILSGADFVQQQTERNTPDDSCTAWHALPEADVLNRLQTDAHRGLTSAEAEVRRNRYGPNALRTTRPRPGWKIFALQFHQPLIYILIGAGAATAALSHWVDASVIFGVVLVNALIGYLQEAKAVKSLEALSRSLFTPALVVRSGHRSSVHSTELVPGDVVIIQSGDRAPADVRLVLARELRVDESALTGESVPVEKRCGVLPDGAPLAERTNMLHSTCLVTQGQGVGVVVNTGSQTEVGRISELMEQTTELMTPLTRDIARFSRLMLVIILAFAAAAMGVGLYHGLTFIDVLLAGVALAVGAIPEGLPAAVTITLAIGVNSMARRNAIIRKLPAVETLGSTTVICTDKTGTLTENQMTVREIMTASGSYGVSGQGFQPEGNIDALGESLRPEDNDALKETLICGMLCNDAELQEQESGYTVAGDPTEGALLTAGHKHGLRHSEVTRNHTRFDAIGFESERQYMATLHHIPHRNTRTVYVKGAVERILERASHMLTADGTNAPIDADLILAATQRMSAEGLRVLAFARIDLDPAAERFSHDDFRTGMTFLGLQGMIDPPRKEVMVAIEKCKRAGILVKMITGDHAWTALAIARKLGLDDQRSPHQAAREAGSTPKAEAPDVLDGSQLARLTQAEFDARALDVHVFARVTPEQKLRLVQALQRAGHVTAMTGDGVNDGPALRQADIGVAMGRSGTEVAKEAADMVLTDDNFASIQAAVEEGRTVFDNLKKFIVWALPTNMGEGMIILVSLLFGTTLPILPAQILWVNMTTAVLLGLVLAFEPKEPQIMDRPPRSMKQPLLDKQLVRRIALVGGLMLAGGFGLFHWAQAQGYSTPAARTLAVNVFVLMETAYLFNCRSLFGSVFSLGLWSNRYLIAGIALQLALQMAFTYTPWMNALFQTEPIDLRCWAMASGVAGAVALIVAVEKWIGARPSGKRVPSEETRP